MKSKIEWTESTWNPVVGCSKVSSGCDNCYAEKMAGRLACMGQPKYMTVTKMVGTKPKFLQKWNGHTFCDESALEIPLHWKKSRMIFVSSMGDLFHPSVPFEFIAEVYKVAAFTEWHTYQFLTKRIKRALEFFKWLENKYTYDGEALMFRGEKTHWQYKPWPLPNVWLGTTAENQEMADKRIPILLQIPAAVRFVSVEPMLGEMDLRKRIDVTRGCCVDLLRGNFYDIIGRDGDGQAIFSDMPSGTIGHGRGIDWVIVGCESGPKRRECKIEWVQSIADQCKQAGVPVFVKQIPINGKVVKDINQFPEDLRIREYPG